MAKTGMAKNRYGKNRDGKNGDGKKKVWQNRDDDKNRHGREKVGYACSSWLLDRYLAPTVGGDQADVDLTDIHHELLAGV